MIKDIDNLKKQTLRVLTEMAELREELKEERKIRKAERRAIFMEIITELDMIHQEERKAPLLNILQKHNISQLAAPFNQVADFSVVEQTIQNSELEDGTVLAVLRDAYLLGDQLFRPAGLCVVKNS